MNPPLLSLDSRLRIVAAVALTWASCLLSPAPLTAVPLTFSAPPTLAEITRSRALAQPLLPMGSAEPSATERSALAQALVTFNHASNSEDTSALEGFLAAYPQSAFRVSLLTNLGLMYRQNGYWSKALSAWQQAWQDGKSETDPAKQMVVDQALSHLAELTARIGRRDDLQALFTDAGNRVMSGPSAEQYSSAQESLYLMRNKPTKSFRCGPFAVGQIIHALQPERHLGGAIHDSVSTDHGTSLVMVNAFAHSLGLDYQLAYRNPGAAVLVPSVVNWKVGHYAALTQEVNGRYVVKDSTFTDTFVVSTQALDQEASGYFLVPAGTLPPGWRTVSDQEGAQVWGKGAVPPSTPPCPPCTSPSSCEGMALHSVDLSRINLFLNDTPFFYSPPRGPAVAFMATYSQRDSTPNTVASFPNLGVQWNCNWVAFIVDDPSNVKTSSYGPGGGNLTYTGYGTTTPSAFAPQADTQAVLQRTSATSYVRTYPDGSQEVFGFAQSIGGVNYILMTESDDPAGNRLLYNYNAGTGRLDTVVDTMGNTITLTYASNTAGAANYYAIAGLSDTAGRSASFAYDPTTGLLNQITDMVGLQSKFTYGTGSVVTKLTTPYGATTFAENDNVQAQSRDLVITDPEGGREHFSFAIESTAPDGNPTPPTASGFILDAYYGERNTFYWDKQACAAGENDPGKAHLYHWLEVPGGGAMSDILGSEKPALESRIWYNYVGQQTQGEPYWAGNSNLPTMKARVLTNGSTQQTQLTRHAYNAQGKLTQLITPANRVTTWQYASNGIDLLNVYQENPGGTSNDASPAGNLIRSGPADLIRALTYDTQGKHLVMTSADAAGQVTFYTYNGYGQPLTVQQTVGGQTQTTTFAYDRDQEGVSGVTDGNLLTLTGPASGATTTFGYNNLGLVTSVEDSAGYTVGLTYDALNRVTTRSYPDGTYEETDYDNLDPGWTRDRLGRWTQILHDTQRHPTVVIDPLGRITQYDWCSCGSLAGITDPNGNHTVWMRDAQSRVTAKVYPDNSVWSATYDPSTGRVSSTNDPKGQSTTYTYNLDTSLASVSYTVPNGNTPTPSVSYTYDPYYPRLTSMTYGIGTNTYTTTYSYNPVGSLGAGKIASEYEPYSKSTIAYTYDQLGRGNGLSINGTVNSSTIGYDTLGRLSQVTNALDTFTYNYVANTSRLNSVTSQYGPGTQYAYYPLPSDPRLQTLTNSTGSGTVSQFGYTYSAVGDLLSWTQSNSGGGDAQRYGFGYDADSELTSATLQDTVTGGTLSALAYAYDAAGNRVSVQNGGSVTTETPNNLNQLTGTSGGGLARFAGTVSVSSTPAGNKLASVSVGGNAATVRADGSYEGWAPVSGTGTTSVAIVATDSNNVSTTKHASVPASAVAGQQFGYDPDGNQTAAGPGGGQTLYGWDALNRLVSITQGSNVTTFDYDGQSRRVRESLNGTEVRHWIWIGTTLAEERNAANAVTKRFFGQGEQIAGQNYYYTRDHLGTVRELVDGTQTVRARYSYDPYGARSANLITSNPVEADFGFTGHYFHQQSGLHLALYREYNQSIGRWLSRDPIQESGGLNLYNYCLGNVTGFIDFLGLLSPNLITEGIIAANQAVQTSQQQNPVDGVRPESDGYIYQRPDGMYDHTAPALGDVNITGDGKGGVTIANTSELARANQPPPKCRVAGTYHNHPSGNNAAGPGDPYMANFTNVPMFIGTAQGVNMVTPTGTTDNPTVNQQQLPNSAIGKPGTPK